MLIKRGRSSEVRYILKISARFGIKKARTKEEKERKMRRGRGKGDKRG